MSFSAAGRTSIRPQDDIGQRRMAKNPVPVVPQQVGLHALERRDAAMAFGGSSVGSTTPRPSRIF